MKKKVLIIIVAIGYVIVTVLSLPDTPKVYSEDMDFLAITNPPIDVQGLVKSACYDCHSTEASFPIYAYFPPISNWIKGHVRHGKGKLNFSKWESYTIEEKREILGLINDEIVKKEMPPSNYLIMHSDAEWSKKESEMVISFINRLSQELEKP
ncbi:heme-binding domain-containing protein [Ekhidna sp.]|uniref:heme-binding domain-containing protein n=1 Tax=Ekhidna sp. TaxID=2608089 RepID=UPI00329830F4